jgi:hypothetical protein
VIARTDRIDVWVPVSVVVDLTGGAVPTRMRLGHLIKAALEEAAKGNDPWASSLVERVMRAWLVEKGYLPAAKSRLSDAPQGGQNQQ